MRTSIVLSTYNGSKYIFEQLESLKHQDYMPEEVLICDDCSNDNTYEIVNDYIEGNKLSEWKCYKNTINLGWKKNFIEGIKKSSGDLIFLCDQDDYWYEYKIKKMRDIMIDRPEINVLVSKYDEFFENGKVNEKKIQSSKISIIKPEKSFMNIRYPGCVYCVRKSFFDAIFPYWDATFPHDAFFWRFAMFSNSLYMVHFSTIRQRKHNASTFTKEAIESKTIAKQLEYTTYTKNTINAIKHYLQDNNRLNYSNIKLLNGALKWNKLREDYLLSKKISTWFSLLRYINYYPTYKKYLLDLYLVIKNK